MKVILVILEAFETFLIDIFAIKVKAVTSYRGFKDVSITNISIKLSLDGPRLLVRSSKRFSSNFSS